ncbi:hypothetical protein ACJX0J_000437 (mitochondrion) [Zea mays]
MQQEKGMNEPLETRYLDCQSKETSTSRYPFPLAKKNRHDKSLSIVNEKQGYYPDIDENEEDLVQKMMHALAFFYSFVNRSASLGIRHQNYKTGVGVAVFLLVKKLK